MITEMGSRGWELACMLETPEVTNVGLGNITYKVLFFFQRKIIRGQVPPNYAPQQGAYQAGYPPTHAQGGYAQQPPPGGHNYTGAQQYPPQGYGPPPPYSDGRLEPSAPPPPEKR